MGYCKSNIALLELKQYHVLKSWLSKDRFFTPRRRYKIFAISKPYSGKAFTGQSWGPEEKFNQKKNIGGLKSCDNVPLLPANKERKYNNLERNDNV